MDGIRHTSHSNCNLFLIDSFSEELKNSIRNQLSSVWHGLSEVEELPSAYTYSKTLRSFLDIYNGKTEDTKKGMIGELVTHILINSKLTNLTSLSILKNKEERSIKKGFDIVYYHPDSGEIWYSEVKSGSPLQNSVDSNSDNFILLNRAKSGISTMFQSHRTKLWESALIDVKLTIEEGPRRINIRELLSEDLENIQENELKNVILISVLFKELEDHITFASVVEYHENIEDVFKDKMTISIQKATFQAIQNFLIQESMSNG